MYPKFVLICLVGGLVLGLSPSILPRRSTLQVTPRAPPPEPGHAVRLVRVIITTCPMPFTAIYHRERCPRDPNRSLKTLPPLSPLRSLHESCLPLPHSNALPLASSFYVFLPIQSLLYRPLSILPLLLQTYVSTTTPTPFTISLIHSTHLPHHSHVSLTLNLSAIILDHGSRVCPRATGRPSAPSDV
jgi:hypothetical protein